MKHIRLYSFIAVLLSLLLLVQLAAGAVTQEEIDELQRLRDELAEKQQSTQEKIDRLIERQSNVLELKAALDENKALAEEQLALVRQQLEVYDAMIAEYDGYISECDAIIGEYDEMIESKSAALEDARAAEEQQLTRLRVRVRAMEENGGYDMLELLMKAQTVSEILSAMDDISQIMESDRMLEEDYTEAIRVHEEALRDYNSAKEEYEEVRSQYETTRAGYLAEKEDLDSRERLLREEQENLESLIAHTDDLLAGMEKDLEEALADFEKAEKERQEAEERILALIEELNRQREEEEKKPKPTPTPTPPSDPTPTPPPSSTPAPETEPQPTPGDEPAPEPTPAPTPEPEGPPVGDGSLCWPVPSSHTVTSRFGMRIHPITGEESYHSGIDIDGYGNDGGAIVACDAGVVVLAEWYGGYGNCIIIDHGNGMQTLYGHMSGYAVSAGDWISKGQLIGYLGATGTATGTHCHLEVFVDGGRVDPANYFSGITYYDC